MPIFRRATKEDVKHIAALEGRVFSDAWTVQGITETYDQPQTFLTVAEENGVIVGYCIVYYVLEEGEIARIAVDEKIRRQGVGRGLLDYTMICCRQMKLQRVLLDVRESNAAARAFYVSYGFAEDGMRKNFYDNPKEHAILMSMLLE